jgi:4-alpha-glucanotransferase
MERQLAALSAAHGLLLDLPLGVHPEGFDARRWPGVLVSGASTGAPPDSFFTGGQDWCSPPLHPEADRTAGYAYFRACLANLMRPASVLRIDHVMSLHRLFWIPEGAHPRDGVYVTYPAEEMYALLSCESHRHHTEIVGEDLGTVPPGVRTRMRSHALARTWIYVWSLRPRAALMTAAVPPDSLATLGTHDMVPLAGFLEGDDIQIRVETGQLAPEEAYRESARRSRLVDRLSAGLRAPEAGPGRAAAILAGALAYLGRSAARMVLVNLEDLLLERRPQNVPGTALERPNWRCKIAVTIEQLPDYSDARK